MRVYRISLRTEKIFKRIYLVQFIRFRSRRGKMRTFRIWLRMEKKSSEFIKVNLFVFVRDGGK
jgi:hypothetical protein